MDRKIQITLHIVWKKERIKTRQKKNPDFDRHSVYTEKFRWKSASATEINLLLHHFFNIYRLLS